MSVRFNLEKLKILVELEEFTKAIELLAEITQNASFAQSLNESDIDTIVEMKKKYTSKQKNEQLQHINSLTNSSNYLNNKFKYVIDDYAVVIQSEFYEEVESYIESLNILVEKIDSKENYIYIIKLTKALASLYKLVYENFNYSKSKYLELAFAHYQKGIQLCIKHLKITNKLRLEYTYSLCKFNRFHMNDKYRSFLMVGRVLKELRQCYVDNEEIPDVVGKLVDFQKDSIDEEEYEYYLEIFNNNRK